MTLASQNPRNSVAYNEGVKAQEAGVKWWEGVYPSGSKEAYQWFLGHTSKER